MYRIKVENMETGKIEIESISDCIIGVMHLPEESSIQNLAATCCKAPVIAGCLEAISDLSMNVIRAVIFGDTKED